MRTFRAVRFCFHSLVVAQIVSILGDRLHQFSVVGMIGRVAPGSSSELFKLSLFMQVPVLLLAPLFGAFLDRANKAVLLVSIDALRGLIVLAIPALYHATGSLYAFYVPVLLLAASNMIFAPAKSAIIPEKFGPEHLLHINAVLWVTGVIGTLAGFLLGGWFFDFRTWELSFYVDGVSYFVSVVFLVPLVFLAPSVGAASPKAEGQDNGWRRGVIASIRDGVRLIPENRSIAFGLGAQAVLVASFGVAWVVGVARIQSVLPTGRTLYLSVVASSAMAGLLLGSALVAAVRRRLTPERIVAHSAVILGVTWIGLALSESVVSLALWACGVGLGVSPIWITTETLLQARTPGFYLGRVFSAREVLTKSAFLLASSIGAMLAVFVDKGAIMIAVGVLLAGIGVSFQRRVISMSNVIS